MKFGEAIKIWRNGTAMVSGLSAALFEAFSFIITIIVISGTTR